MIKCFVILDNCKLCNMDLAKTTLFCEMEMAKQIQNCKRHKRNGLQVHGADGWLLYLFLKINYLCKKKTLTLWIYRQGS